MWGVFFKCSPLYFLKQGLSTAEALGICVQHRAQAGSAWGGREPNSGSHAYTAGTFPTIALAHAQIFLWLTAPRHSRGSCRIGLCSAALLSPPVNILVSSVLRDHLGSGCCFSQASCFCRVYRQKCVLSSRLSQNLTPYGIVCPPYFQQPM